MTCAIAAAIVHCTGLIREQLGGCLGLDTPLPYTSLSIAVQDELHVAGALGAVVRLLADVLAAPVTVVTRQFAVLHVTGELEPGPTLAGDATLLRFPADVCTAVVLVHAGGSLLCAFCLHFRPLDAGMLVVTQEESFSAAALIAAHHVDANLLASTVAFRALIHVETVVSIVCQAEAVVTRAPVISRDVDALVDAAAVVFGRTLVNIFAVFAVPFIARLADAFV